MTAPVPGAIRNIGPADACPCQYDECSAMATHEYLVESDSMGDEWLPLCQEHMEQFKKDAEEPIVASCDWCHANDVIVAPMRDWEEGSHGPVYDVCETCRGKHIDRMHEEANAGRRDDDEEEEEEFSSNPLADMEDDDVLDIFEEQEEDYEAWDREQAEMTLRNRLVHGPCDSCRIDELEREAESLGSNLSHNKHMACVGPQVVPTGLQFAFFWDGIPFVIAEWKSTGQVIWYSTQAPRYYHYSVHALLQIKRKLSAMGYPVVSMENSQSWDILL